MQNIDWAALSGWTYYKNSGLLFKSRYIEDMFYYIEEILLSEGLHLILDKSYITDHKWKYYRIRNGIEYDYEGLQKLGRLDFTDDDFQYYDDSLRFVQIIRPEFVSGVFKTPLKWKVGFSEGLNAKLLQEFQENVPKDSLEKELTVIGQLTMSTTATGINETPVISSLHVGDLLKLENTDTYIAYGKSFYQSNCYNEGFFKSTEIFRRINAQSKYDNKNDEQNEEES